MKTTYTLHDASRCTVDGSPLWIATVRISARYDTFEGETPEDAEHAMRSEYPNAVLASPLTQEGRSPRTQLRQRSES